MKLSERKIGGQTVYDGKILRLEVDEVELPDGKTSKRECVRHGGGACVLYVKEGKILLVKQFRYLYGKEIYEIPAGKLEKGEDPKITALRELEEEAGLVSDDAELYLKLFPTPGYTDEIIYVYKIENAKEGKKHPDEGEFVNALFMPLDEVIKRIESGEICDAKTVSAIYKHLSQIK